MELNLAMADSEQSFERTKLKKQLTQRKRGKEPSAAAASQPEETKSVGASSVTSSSRKQSFLYKKWREYAPSYL